MRRRAPAQADGSASVTQGMDTDGIGSGSGGIGPDLRSRRLIVAKGLLLLALALIAGGMVVLETRSWRVAALLAICVWASARFHFFCYHVLERWVDPLLRWNGLLALAMAVWRRRRG